MSFAFGDKSEASHSLKTRAVSGALWVTVETVGVQGTSFVVFAVLAHFLRPRDFGLMSVSFLAVQSLEMLILYNISTVAFRKQFVTNRDFTTAFWVTISLSILSCLALIASSSVVTLFFHMRGLTIVLRSMSVILLFMGLSRTHEAWLIRHFQFRSLALRGIVGAVAGGITGIVLAVLGFGVLALVGQQVVNSLVSVVLLWLICPWRPSFSFSVPAAKEIFAFMCRMVPNNLVYATNQNCDTFLVALFFGPISAGFYNVGKRVRLALQLVAGDPIKAIGLPTLAEIQGDPDRLRSGVIKSITVVCALCSPIFVGTSAVSDDAIRVIFGPAWEHSGPVLQFLAIGGLAMVLMTYNDNIFVLKGRPVWCLWLSLCYCILAITAMLICVELKVRSFALPFVLPYVVVLPFSYLLVCKLISIPPRAILRAILPGMSSAAFMFIAVKFAGGYYQNYCHIIRLLVLCIIGVFSYSLVLCGIWGETTKLLLDTFRQVRHIKSPSI